MAKKLLVSVLKDTLGKYVDGLTDENLQVNILLLNELIITYYYHVDRYFILKVK